MLTIWIQMIVLAWCGVRAHTFSTSCFSLFSRGIAPHMHVCTYMNGMANCNLSTKGHQLPGRPSANSSFGMMLLFQQKKMCSYFFLWQYYSHLKRTPGGGIYWVKCSKWQTIKCRGHPKKSSLFCVYKSSRAPEDLLSNSKLCTLAGSMKNRGWMSALFVLLVDGKTCQD